MITAVGAARTWVGTSWKMNGTLAAAAAYADALRSASLPSGDDAPVVFVLPPLTALAAVADRLHDTPVLVGAQNAHWEPDGPVTGEVSMTMIADAGATLVEIGHSDRRDRFGETDEVVAAKIAAAERDGLIPLLCVGESAAVRDAGQAGPFVEQQVRLALAGSHDPAGVIIAYEPVWAIGTAGRAATPAEVAPVTTAIAATVADLTGGGRPRALLYGGSVDVGNAVDFLADPATDGLFVGRAALDPTDFLALVEIATAQTVPA